LIVLIITDIIEMNIGTLLTLTLSLALAAASSNTAAAQAAQPVPVRPAAPAQMSGSATVPASPQQFTNKAPTPARQTVPGNPANQAANEPVQTRIVRIYRGDGYFDLARADKLRRALTAHQSVDPKVVAAAGRP
jgi:hypothetical protein